MCTETNTYYNEMMEEALKEAELAGAAGEVPIGAVIARDGKVISRGHNRRETEKNALLHAEIEAIDGACKALGGWRLEGCDIFVTLEPCPMCSGAIINSRINTVVFGARDKKAGCCGTLMNLFDFPFNHRPSIVAGIMEKECSEVLKNFFSALRDKKRR